MTNCFEDDGILQKAEETIQDNIDIIYSCGFYKGRKEGIEQGKKDLAVNFDRLFNESYEQGKIDLLKDIEINLQKDDGYIHISMIKELMKDKESKGG